MPQFKDNANILSFHFFITHKFYEKIKLHVEKIKKKVNHKVTFKIGC